MGSQGEVRDLDSFRGGSAAVHSPRSNEKLKQYLDNQQPQVFSGPTHATFYSPQSDCSPVQQQPIVPSSASMSKLSGYHSKAVELNQLNIQTFDKNLQQKRSSNFGGGGCTSLYFDT